ncbi:MAG TPA: SpoIIE family protein phosphatase, partial [Thermoanaerobaculia bacterium]|nr:SpoIIE family protein phosphatase [Thermoanaerobaculia bacterium]
MASAVGTRPVEKFDAMKDLREALLSVLVGVGVVFLMFFARPGLFGWRLAAYGALAGFLIYVCCRTLHRLVVESVPQRQKLPRPVVAAIVYFFGGVAGWGSATLIAQSVRLTHFVFSAQDIGITLAVTGSLAIVIGLAFYSFGRLEGRLRESVERLKEAEFAEKELELARSIQRRLLPPAEIEGDGYRVAARNLPARFVAGDFYDVFPLSDGTVGLVVADVSGKGIGASLIMASVKSVVPLVASGRSVSETLRELNRKLSGELAAREFVALA